ncbi:hypothetical protein [Streptomyces sp. NPDC095613]|uniref:hypothetical protein n=1 Tax=Streptomyces sp. NPDC095613 TaxID=3155540 RepID=UPI00331FD665
METPTSRLSRQTAGVGRAVVVSGSLAGLMTGLALARSGIEVAPLERVSAFPAAVPHWAGRTSAC